MGFRIERGGTIASVASPAPSQSEGDPGSAPMLGGSGEERLSPAFLLAGVVLSFVGAILPVWGYHLTVDLAEVGEYFLTLNAGFWLAETCARGLVRRNGLKLGLVLASAAACVGFLSLTFFAATFFAAPGVIGGRLWAVLCLGATAGLLQISMGTAMSAHPSSKLADRAWALGGLGCAATALLVAGSYYVYSVPAMLIFFAIFSAACVGYCLKTGPRRIGVQAPSRISNVFRSINHPGAVLFSLVLFVQFGNESVVGTWLALFLIRRLGLSPPAALLLVAVYWMVLMLGRAGSRIVMRRVRTGLKFGASLVISLLGLIVLASTNNRFGAVMGVIFAAAGLACTYDLVANRMAHRLAADQARLYDATSLAAVAGALIAPCWVAYAAQSFGIGAAMMAPALGTLIVFLLILVTVLEAKLSGSAM